MHYSRPDLEASDDDEDRAQAALLRTRGEILHKTGKLMLKLMYPFAEKAAEKNKSSRKLSLEDRDKLHEAMKFEEKLAKLETEHRKILVSEHVYKESSLPKRRTEEKIDDLACRLDKKKNKKQRRTKKRQRASLHRL